MDALNVRFESLQTLLEFYLIRDFFPQKLTLFDTEKVKLFKSAKFCEAGLYMAKKKGLVRSI